MASITRVSKRGKRGRRPRAVYLDMGIWLNEKTGNIHMASGDKRFRHTTVSNKPGSKRYHPNLYQKLRAVLQAEGRWP
jgi:hypothetical protein